MPRPFACPSVGYYCAGSYRTVAEVNCITVKCPKHPRSSIIDAQFTQVMLGNMVRVISWYDNEWAYSVRLADLANYIAERL